jgi:peptide/nickel transport system permease protein
MPPFLKFLLSRLLAIPVTLLIITAVLYGIIMLAPAEERAMLYWPPRSSRAMSPEVYEARLAQIIEDHYLDKSYLQQYSNWLINLIKGDWGYSPVMKSDVLPILLKRTPVTIELTLYSVLLFSPLGVISGILAGWKHHSPSDAIFRLAAFLATSIPPFVLALSFLSVFYVGLRWFPIGRTSLIEISFSSSNFQSYTGLLTIDGLLNGRSDVTVDAFRHLAMPVLVLSLSHWATLGRITRIVVVEEKSKEYIIAAHARGLPPRLVLWRHAFRNGLGPALTSSALSAASLITGIFIIEAIFDFNGLSALITRSVFDAPDAPLALGFAVFSVLLVIPWLFILDIIRGLVDPRVRENI